MTLSTLGALSPITQATKQADPIICSGKQITHNQTVTKSHVTTQGEKWHQHLKC